MRVGLDRADVTTGAERLDQRRELPLRHLAGGGGEAADRTDHGARHEPDQEEREQHGEHRERRRRCAPRAGPRSRCAFAVSLITPSTASIAWSSLVGLTLVVDVVLARRLRAGGERGRQRGGVGRGAHHLGECGELLGGCGVAEGARGVAPAAAWAPIHSLKSCGWPLASTAMYTLASRACSCWARSSENVRVRLAAMSALARSRATRSPKSRRWPSTPRKKSRVDAAVAVCTSTLPRFGLDLVEARFVASSAASAAGLRPAVANACSLSRNSLHRGVGAGARLLELGLRRAATGDVPRRHDALVLEGAAGLVERVERTRQVAVLLLRVEGGEPVAQTGGGDDDQGEERHEQDEQQLGAEAQSRGQRLSSLQASQIELHPFLHCRCAARNAAADSLRHTPHVKWP